MSSLDDSADEAIQMLNSLLRRGVRLWLEGGQLRYRARKGILTPTEVELLRRSKTQIVSFLERSTDRTSMGPMIGGNERLRSAPLSFTQLAYWRMCESGEQPSLRNVASATRIGGVLNVGALQVSLSETVRRQDALRTRIVKNGGEPVQEVRESVSAPLRIEDLTALPPAARELEIQRRISELILQPIDVSTDDLFAALLLKVQLNEHVLILAMEHMIADARSLGILLRDILAGYARASQGLAIDLPPPAVQFAAYAAWQRNLQSSWIASRSALWDQHLANRPRLRFPDQLVDCATARSGWGLIPFQIDRDLMDALLTWCRSRRTTVVLAVLTVYAALLVRWCLTSDLLLRYQTDGRNGPDLDDTIGYFASPLYLRIQADDAQSFVELLHQVTEEYCKARDCADFSYREAWEQRPEFTRNGCFNWRPRPPEAELLDAYGATGGITCRDLPIQLYVLENLQRDTEPEVGFIDTGGEIHVHIQYPLHRFAMATMERFGRNLLLFVRELLRDPQQQIARLPLI